MAPFAGAAIRFVTGRTSQQLEACTPSIDYERSLAFPSPNPGSMRRRRRRLSRIACRPSAISPAVEPLSRAEQVTVNPRPFFVPSTASASEILTNVAVQDLLAADDAEVYDLPCHYADTSALASVSDSWDSFDFVNPFAHDDYSDPSSEDLEEWIAEESPQSSPRATESSRRFGTLGSDSLPSSVHINKDIRFVSSSVVEVTFRNTRPDSPGEDDGDGEEEIIIPVTPFPHPHLLSTIIEEDEEEDSAGSETCYEDEGEMSDTETIRPSSTCLQLSMDAEVEEPFGNAWHYYESSPCVQTDRRMSI